MLAACWFAVLKAGGICVCTMPLLRARELQYVADKAEITLALDRRALRCEDSARKDGRRIADARASCTSTAPPRGLDALMRAQAATFDEL